MKLEQIDTSTTEGKAEVMLLAAKGRKVAARYASSAPMLGVRAGFIEVMFDPRLIVWNWEKADYAIIAEPVGPEEIFVNVYPSYCVSCYDNAEDAVKYAGPTATAKGVRYVRAD